MKCSICDKSILTERCIVKEIIGRTQISEYPPSSLEFIESTGPVRYRHYDCKKNNWNNLMTDEAKEEIKEKGFFQFLRDKVETKVD